MQKPESYSTWCERIQQPRRWPCVLGSFSRRMPIPNRAINNWPQLLAPPTAPCANGVGGGSKPISLLTRPAVERRGVFPPQVRVQVTAIACSLPKQEQVPLSRWSRAELAQRVTRDPALAHISASTVSRWLKAERLRSL